MGRPLALGVTAQRGVPKCLPPHFPQHHIKDWFISEETNWGSVDLLQGKGTNASYSWKSLGLSSPLRMQLVLCLGRDEGGLVRIWQWLSCILTSRVFLFHPNTPKHMPNNKDTSKRMPQLIQNPVVSVLKMLYRSEIFELLSGLIGFRFNRLTLELVRLTIMGVDITSEQTCVGFGCWSVYKLSNTKGSSRKQ